MKLFNALVAGALASQNVAKKQFYSDLTYDAENDLHHLSIKAGSENQPIPLWLTATEPMMSIATTGCPHTQCEIDVKFDVTKSTSLHDPENKEQADLTKLPFYAFRNFQMYNNEFTGDVKRDEFELAFGQDQKIRVTSRFFAADETKNKLISPYSGFVGFGRSMKENKVNNFV